ncbi:NAD dependent epimerase/dehydratase [Dacryopinax primogenitus]|uniref:NAD dependent epimerase/dehydratase n=1 Tax=Dacryopinax primogenitus (strain DJM 731) TaxID=1858805 RepID=M5FZN7_DACPD|nr:NAD dependent epimerase/dehydratase [Dacryopinax primogenitus]EJU01350.1 NAD dependent epimerase/dehydratase [Dacryopinax primogenitus]
MDLGLNKVHALVTGASGGIGFAITKLFLEQGALVTAHYNTEPRGLQDLKGKPEWQEKLCIAGADLSKEEDVDLLFKKARSELGDITVLIVSHGIWPENDAPVVDMELQQWQNTLAVNLTGPFLTTRAFLRQLREPSTRPAILDKVAVILIGSTAGKFGEAGHIDYASSKSALQIGFCLTLKNEIVKIAPRGRVNAIAPGWVSTPMAANAMQNPEIKYRALATTPLRKIGTPDDIAMQVAVLSSATVSGHVTGMCVMVEGGMEGRLLNKMEDLA